MVVSSFQIEHITLHSFFTNHLIPDNTINANLFLLADTAKDLHQNTKRQRKDWLIKIHRSILPKYMQRKTRNSRQRMGSGDTQRFSSTSKEK